MLMQVQFRSLRILQANENIIQIYSMLFHDFFLVSVRFPEILCESLQSYQKGLKKK